MASATIGGPPLFPPPLASHAVPQALPYWVFSDFDHEHLHVFRDAASGLTGLVAIHSTALGPAMGGLRIRAYPNIDSAVADGLRLSPANEPGHPGRARGREHGRPRANPMKLIEIVEIGKHLLMTRGALSGIVG